MTTLQLFRQFINDHRTIRTFFPERQHEEIRSVVSIGSRGVWFAQDDGRRSYLDWPKKRELTWQNDHWSVTFEDTGVTVEYWPI